MSENVFDALMGAQPDRHRPFIIQSNGVAVSYDDADALSAQIANAFVASGVAPGDRVAVQVEKSVTALMLYLAAMRAGAIYLPLNPAYTPAEIEYFLNDAKPTLFVCDPGSAQRLDPIATDVGAAVLTLDAEGEGTLKTLAERQSNVFTTAQRGGDDIAAILYTSGTTGRSKGAMLSHGNLLSNAKALVKHWHYTASDVLIHALPIFHTHGLFVATNVTLAAGASILFYEKFDAEQIIADFARATVLMGVPTFYTRLLRQPGLDRAACAHMRLFVSGSAPLLAETHCEWEKVTGHAILERYGMTETNMNTSNPYDGPRIAGTVGHPLPGVELRITAPETGTILPDGEIGMIEVRGPNVFKGYWNMPEKTAAEFRSDGFFITGDLGMIDADGYVRIVGRGKDLIITGGYNVYPKEVEEQIDGLSEVIESAVFGVPHPDFGEAIVAAAVLHSGKTLPESAMLEQIAPQLARYKQPKRLILLDELPRNTMGKVQKNVLRERYAALFVKGADRTDSAVEQVV